MTFKVGDKGKTRGGDDYEVIAILGFARDGRDVVAKTSHEDSVLTSVFFPDGRWWNDPADPPETAMDLLPPQQKIATYIAVWKNNTLTAHASPVPDCVDFSKLRAVVPVTIEYIEGEGL